MTKANLSALLFVCLAGAPLWAMNTEEDKEPQPTPLAAAAEPTSAPRKVCPEACVLDYDLLMALKFTNFARLTEKKSFLEGAERGITAH